MKPVLALFSYGGVEEYTVDCVIAELGEAGRRKQFIGYQRISGDALIERSRSRALGRFLESKEGHDVMIMIDHDIQWRPGDALHVCEQALEKNALVGGLYCKRAKGKGWSSRVPHNGALTFGKPGLIETPALATGFMAIPRTVAQGVIDKLEYVGDIFKKEWTDAVDKKDHARIALLQDLSIGKIADGAYRSVEFRYYDFFRCMRWESQIEGAHQFLSEDWAFACRAGFCGFKSYISTQPVLVHHGGYGYTIPDGMDDRDTLDSKEPKVDGPNTDPDTAKTESPGAGGTT